MAPDLAGVALTVWLAQTSPAQPAPVPPAITQPELPVSVDRIQKELARPAPIETEESMATFRLTIEARPMRFKPLWDTTDPMLPSYVRPRMPLYHYEFLMAVTPEAFRGGALYPISINVLPGVELLADRIRRGLAEATRGACAQGSGRGAQTVFRSTEGETEKGGREEIE